MGNGLYVYKMSDLYHEELHLNKWLVSFVKDLGYLGGVIPQDKVSEKHLKWRIDTHLLMVPVPRKRDILFLVCLWCPWIFIANSLVCNMLTLLMIVCKFDEGWGGTPLFKERNMVSANNGESLKYFRTDWWFSSPRILWECYCFGCFWQSLLMLSHLILVLLMGLGPRPSREYQVPHLEEE